MFYISLLRVTKALKQREREQPAHLTPVLSGTSSSLGDKPGRGGGGG